MSISCDVFKARHPSSADWVIINKSLTLSPWRLLPRVTEFAPARRKSGRDCTHNSCVIALYRRSELNKNSCFLPLARSSPMSARTRTFPVRHSCITVYPIGYIAIAISQSYCTRRKRLKSMQSYCRLKTQ